MNKHANLINSVLISILLFMGLQACTKSTSLTPDNIKPDSAVVVTKPADPATVVTQGFFLDNWQPKSLVVPAFTDVENVPAGTVDATVTVDAQNVITKVSPYLFGNNINTFMSQVVTEPALLKNITNLAPKIIRAPGGSLSDLFFWSAVPGVKPTDVPANITVMGNKLGTDTALWYGKNTAPWTLSVDNYYQTLQTTNSTGIITINYGYARYGTSAHPDQAAAHMAAEWVRYDRGRTKFWEIGNENYGIWEAGYKIDVTKNKDGQPETLTGALYGQHFKVFADSMRKAAAEVNSSVKIGAVMTASAVLGGTIIPNWNADVLAAINTNADFYVVHNYYTPFAENSKAATILNTPATETRNMMTYIQASTSVAPKPIALSEWNIQATGNNQDVSNIAGLHAAMVLGEVIQSKYGEASRWALAGVWNKGDDMGLFSAGDEPGGAAKWSPRPAFFYMYYFQKYFGDRMVASTVTGNTDVVSYASTFTTGQAGVVLVNKGTADHVVTLDIKNFKAGARYYYYTLKGGADAIFSRQVIVNGAGPSGVSGGPDDYTSVKPFSINVVKGLKVNVPAYGAVFLAVESK